jgi:glycosyltransferase involved in cell wall biosynthesis
MNPINLTIVMTTYNRVDLLKQNIASLLSSEYSFELLIVDDASSDQTEKTVKSFRDARIAYYRNSVNRGYAKSLNIGIKHAKNAQILLCEDDAFILNPNAFFRVLLSEIKPKTIVATRLLTNGKESRLGLIGRVKRFFAESLAGEVYLYNGHERKAVKFCNNCFCFNKNEINTRFNERDYVGNVFRIESDFQFRALKEGAQIIYNPELVIDHRRYVIGGLRVPEENIFLYQCMINHITFLKKHYARWKIYAYVALRLSMRSPEWSVIRSAFKAYLS